MAMLDAYADLFTDESANQSGITPANFAKPANNRSTARPPAVANPCESLRIAPETGQGNTRFADIRSDSQTVKTAPECALSQDSQHSQGGNGRTFAESTIEPSLMTEIERYCKASTSNSDQLKNWMDYFTELAVEHPAICLRCVTEPPVWKTAAEHEQVNNPRTKLFTGGLEMPRCKDETRSKQPNYSWTWHCPWD